MVLLHATLFIVLTVVKRLPEHVQVDDPAALRKLAKKLERQQVGGGLDTRPRATGQSCRRFMWCGSGSCMVGSRTWSLLGRGNLWCAANKHWV